jgi:hypothetical protein
MSSVRDDATGELVSTQSKSISLEVVIGSSSSVVA